MDITPNTLKPSPTVPLVFRDRIILLTMSLLLALLLTNRDQAVESLVFTGTALIHISPWFALAILFAAYAKASGLDQLIARAFSGRPGAAIVAGSLAGALSPFCSCGVIPVIAGMLASGVPLAPVMAFCMASPIMDPEMFILTAAAISVDFAIAKTVTAIGMGLLSGFSVLVIQRLGHLRQPLKVVAGCGCGQTGGGIRGPVKIHWKFWREPARKAAFREQVGGNGLFLGKWMTLAFFIESLMIAYVPTASVARFVGSDSALAIPLAAIIGVPAYMNGYAAIPLVSGLMNLGMAPGAALAFVTAGAVSSIPAAMAVYALVKRSVFLVYLGMGLTGSLIAGFVYQWMQAI